MLQGGRDHQGVGDLHYKWQSSGQYLGAVVDSEVYIMEVLRSRWFVVVGMRSVIQESLLWCMNIHGSMQGPTC